MRQLIAPQPQGQGQLFDGANLEAGKEAEESDKGQMRERGGARSYYVIKRFVEKPQSRTGDRIVQTTDM